MAFSLNEIEAMGKRAARGAGLPWGLAEEAGKAARWLTARGLSGPEELAEILTRNDGRSYEELAPTSEDGVWRTRSECLCPLVTGAALCDRAAEIAAGRKIELGPVAQPLLLAPYVAAAAKLTGATVELCWAGVEIILAPEGISIKADDAALKARNADSVNCRRTEKTAVALPADVQTPTVDAETWSRLNAFAQRTFAPATETSRLAGAGAGLTDND